MLAPRFIATIFSLKGIKVGIMTHRGSWEMVAAMVICGTIGITVLSSNQSEIDLIFYRCLFGSLVLLAVVLLKGYIQQYLSKRVLLLSVIGGICLLANWYFLFSAYQLTSVGIATTVYNTQPLMMIAFGVFLFQEKVTFEIIFWAIISVIGLGFISELTSHSNEQSALYLLGIGQALLAAFLYALAAIAARKLKGTPPALIAFLQLIVGAVLLFPFANLSIIISPNFSTGTISTVLLGVLHTGIMYLLLYGAIQKIEAWRVASISFLYPAIAITLDAAFLDVRLNVEQYFGILFILIGAAGINLGWKVPFKRDHLKRGAKVK